VEQTPISQAAHTRVPNIVADWIEPLLSTSERDCLRYIIRRTIGYAAPGGGRKARDTIALEQFENGQTVGNYLRDGGTGLARGTIKTALDNLEAKELVVVRYSCTTCLWEHQPGEPEPKPVKEGQTPPCPRCRRTLSRSWAIAPITPAMVIKLLNEYDKKGRTWHWDKEQRMPYWEEDSEVKDKRKRSEEDLREEAIRLYKLLWFRDDVETCIKLAEQQLKAGRKITMTRRISNFYKPVLALQEEYKEEVLKYALEQTINGPALRQETTHGWHKYLAKVCKNSANRFSGNKVIPGTNAEVALSNSIENRAAAIKELLKDAYQNNVSASKTNSEEDRNAARAILSDILSRTKDLAELFDGDEQRCEQALRLAFKQGEVEFIGIEYNPYSPVDYYPEWKPTQ
jgi:hypothetical protein